ncbi:uncharacterized protein [Narcine bancroftii]|uniref:uncharacterized protein isoform X3 n=1 Tax=Narcine bancroftii TaxID=1343680 RepID=UPI003830FF7C
MICLRTPFLQDTSFTFGSNKSGESKDVFVLTLKGLSRVCASAAIMAEAHRESLMLDAFISGLKSGYVRQHLLETPGLTFNAALPQAKMLLTVLQGAKALEQGRSAEAAPLRPTRSEDSLLSTTKPQRKSRSTKCYFCGLALHTRNWCPARQDTCANCGKKGYWARACQARESTPGTCGKQRSKKKKEKKHSTADTKQGRRHNATMLSWRVNDSSNPTSTSSTSSESSSGSTSDEARPYMSLPQGDSILASMKKQWHYSKELPKYLLWHLSS